MFLKEKYFKIKVKGGTPKDYKIREYFKKEGIGYTLEKIYSGVHIYWIRTNRLLWKRIKKNLKN